MEEEWPAGHSRLVVPPARQEPRGGPGRGQGAGGAPRALPPPGRDSTGHLRRMKGTHQVEQGQRVVDFPNNLEQSTVREKQENMHVNKTWLMALNITLSSIF